LNVNSAHRLNPLTTTPNAYSISFAPLRRVRSVRLVSTEFTNSRYVIDATNNKLDFTSSAAPLGTYVATLTAGHYASSDLVTELDLQLNAALGAAPSVIMTVSYSATTSKFTISRIDGNTFQLLLSSGTNALQAPLRELGFNRLDTAAGLTTYTAPNCANLTGDDYTMMCIDGLGTLVDATRSINQSQGRPMYTPESVHAKLIWNTPARYATTNSFASAPYLCPQPMMRLDTLRVSFYRPDGSVYDFNGVDHSFSLEVVSD
jgi:hypothetical protein